MTRLERGGNREGLGTQSQQKSQSEHSTQSRDLNKPIRRQETRVSKSRSLSLPFSVCAVLVISTVVLIISTEEPGNFQPVECGRVGVKCAVSWAVCGCM